MSRDPRSDRLRRSTDHAATWFELAADDVLAEFIEARPLVSAFRAADPLILENGDHVPAVTGSDRFQFQAFVVDGLARGRDTEVKCDA